MRLDVYVPLVLAGVFGMTAPALARRLPPAAATWLLSVGGIVCAAGSTTALALLGWTLVGQSPDLAAHGHWSSVTLRQHDLVAPPVARLAVVGLAVVALRVVAAAVRRGHALRAARRLAAALATHDGQLVVVDGSSLPACAVPGRPGRIVMPLALLRVLDAGERRAVLEHERAHLRHRDHVHRTVVGLAAAANPFLRRLPDAVELATERRADEAAARSAPRDTVARALRRAALAAIAVPMRPTPDGVVAAAASHVAERIAALSVPPPRLTVWRIALMVALLAATVLTTVDAADDIARLLELAMDAYGASRGHP